MEANRLQTITIKDDQCTFQMQRDSFGRKVFNISKIPNLGNEYRLYQNVYEKINANNCLKKRQDEVSEKLSSNEKSLKWTKFCYYGKVVSIVGIPTLCLPVVGSINGAIAAASGVIGFVESVSFFSNAGQSTEEEKNLQ